RLDFLEDGEALELGVTEIERLVRARATHALYGTPPTGATLRSASPSATPCVRRRLRDRRARTRCASSTSMPTHLARLVLRCSFCVDWRTPVRSHKGNL